MSQVCIISGCSRGIGKAIATTLAERGYALGLLARSEEVFLVQHLCEKSKDLCSLLMQTEKNMSLFIWHVSPLLSRSSVSKIVSELGKPVGLVNVAGINIDSLAIRAKKSELEALIETNILGTVSMTQAVLPHMMKQRKGSIVTLGSIVGEGGRVGQSGYAMTKSALLGFSRSVAKEMGRFNVRSNVVEPGFIATDMTEKSVRDREELVKKISLGRMGSVEEVANVVSFLLSDAASYITGSVRNSTVL
ncbi:3-oxoacyl-[acyl-carrier-protein] reductase [Blastocystis hominis]|uniref:3-oxoacyl-[acyl-carrier-protein] reductase n=1 Tax=Blastocystis hominis TaxID=12968 RepID=D8M8X3_BLAHO|nr:3-oxoacyl-[acyl-carrier-protein] reductase [Blastocystis hominis]CBK24512.2 3-oxoacyl-[acyl-carrier-protein] reductase [Blastocystis hominis]|eukprot:XP_012898560.1 3-oxoacyl-[acyl-carrier-protein] reductase [Blastocystis hominis]